jgi:hypothetical protein
MEEERTYLTSVSYREGDETRSLPAFVLPQGVEFESKNIESIVVSANLLSQNEEVLIHTRGYDFLIILAMIDCKVKTVYIENTLVLSKDMLRCMYFKGIRRVVFYYTASYRFPSFERAADKAVDLDHMKKGESDDTKSYYLTFDDGKKKLVNGSVHRSFKRLIRSIPETIEEISICVQYPTICVMATLFLLCMVLDSSGIKIDLEIDMLYGNAKYLQELVGQLLSVVKPKHLCMYYCNISKDLWKKLSADKYTFVMHSYKCDGLSDARWTKDDMHGLVRLLKSGKTCRVEGASWAEAFSELHPNLISFDEDVDDGNFFLENLDNKSKLKRQALTRFTDKLFSATVE